MNEATEVCVVSHACPACGLLSNRELDEKFIEVVGKLAMNELAAFGSAALSENDQEA